VKVRRVRICKQVLDICTQARVHWKLRMQTATVRTGNGGDL